MVPNVILIALLQHSVIFSPATDPSPGPSNVEMYRFVFDFFFLALLWNLTALPQDAVQAVELAEETPVGDDASVVLHCFDGLHQGQVLPDHQVGQHQRCWAAHSYGAVDQHFTWIHTKTCCFSLFFLFITPLLTHISVKWCCFHELQLPVAPFVG